MRYINGELLQFGQDGVAVMERIVLTCYDSNLNVPPYAEAHEKMLEHGKAADVAWALAEEECQGLMDGFEGVGSFQVDEGGYPAFVAVRWYSVSPEDMEENSCDIETVTEYNIYPVRFVENGPVRYRGFEIYPNANMNRFAIEQDGVRLTMKRSLQAALNWVDELSLVMELARTLEKAPTEKMVGGVGFCRADKQVDSLLADAENRAKQPQESRECCVVTFRKTSGAGLAAVDVLLDIVPEDYRGQGQEFLLNAEERQVAYEKAAEVVGDEEISHYVIGSARVINSEFGMRKEELGIGE